MILKNFRPLVLSALSILDDYTVAYKIYFTNYSGEKVRIHDEMPFNPERNSHNQSCCVLFSGGQVVVTAFLAAIKDFSTEEEMIASKEFFIGGSRLATRLPVIYNNYGSNEGTSGMIIVGSGDTPPTKEDYKLDSWIPTTNLRVESYQIHLPVEPGFIGPPSEIGTFKTTFRNVTLTNITVKEIGLVIPYCHKDDTLNPPIKPDKILLVRDVLESPVIIKPGELYTFSLTIK